MSSSKRFEKTFSRKKKEKNKSDKDEDEDDDEEQVVLSALAAKSKKPKPSKNAQKEKGDKPEKQKQKKNVANSSSSSNPKQKHQNTEKHKRKVENGQGEVKKKKKTTVDEDDDEEKKEESPECTFPTARIARIIKSEGSDYRLSQETIFLINKATEKFLELFSKDAYDCAIEERKSFIAYKHLSTAVSQEKRFDFLSDFVPKKVTAEKAVAERKPAAETLSS